MGGSVFQLCPACKGALVPLPEVRQAIRKDIQEHLLACVRATRADGSRPCPHCEQAMTAVTVPRGPQAVSVDYCAPCEQVWFDPREYDVLRAMYGEDGPPRPYLHRKWKWAPALLGMPVERDRSALLNRPLMTWTLAAVITLISIAAWQWPVLLFQFSLVPAFAWRLGGITFLTSFFLHGGIAHLLSNLYFLLIFGDNVEDYLGRWRYLLLLLAATLAGDVFHMSVERNSMAGLIGASGGISGLVVFYGLQFPRARLLVMIFRFFPLRIRAIHALLIWFLLQILGAAAQLDGFTNVAYTAHLGGGAAGFLFWLIWRNRLLIPDKPAGKASPA